MPPGLTLRRKAGLSFDRKVPGDFFITASFAFFCVGVFCYFAGVFCMDFKVD